MPTGTMAASLRVPRDYAARGVVRRDDKGFENRSAHEKMIAVIVVYIQEGVGKPAVSKGIRIPALPEKDRDVGQCSGLDGDPVYPGVRPVICHLTVLIDLPEALGHRIRGGHDDRLILRLRDGTLRRIA